MFSDPMGQDVLGGLGNTLLGGCYARTGPGLRRGDCYIKQTAVDQHWADHMGDAIDEPAYYRYIQSPEAARATLEKLEKDGM